MVQRLIVLWLTLLGLASILWGCGPVAASSSTAPQVEQGVLDLRDTPLPLTQMLDLSGEWAFHWQTLALPNELTWPPPANSTFVSVPSNWSQYTLNGQALPAEGYATYQLLLYLPDTPQPYGLYLDSLNHAYNLWIDDHLVATGGHVAHSAQQMIPFSQPRVVFFQTQETPTRLTLQISNFGHRNAGMRRAPVLGEASVLHRYQLGYWFLEVVLFGALVLISGYHWALFIFRPQDRTAFFFALLCLLVAVRIFITGQNQMVYFWPNFSWNVSLRVEYLTFYFAIPLAVVFYHTLYPDVFNKWLVWAAVGLATLFSVYLLMADSLAVSNTITQYQFISAILTSYILLMVLRLLIQRRTGSLLLSISTLIGATTVGLDILYHQDYIAFGPSAPFGFFAFIFLQAILISQQFSGAFHRVEELSDSLQDQNLLLAESEQKYRAVFEESKDLIFIADMDGRFEDSSPASHSILGYSRSEMQTLSLADIFDSPAEADLLRHDLLVQGELKDEETLLRTKDRRPVHALITATLRFNGRGQPVGVQGIIRDISLQVKAQQERFELIAIQQELAIAQDIQQSILPPPLPQWSAVQVACFNTPAREVGGDFYHYHRFTAHHYAFAIGDVSGKGVSAALLMTTSFSLLDAALELNLAPVERIHHLNKTMLPYTKPRSQNCALAYVELSLNQNSQHYLRVVNAGCIPPYIRRANGDIQFEEFGDLALGIELEHPLGYRERRFQLFPGDTVILTSDGAIEAKNAAGEMFGFARLADTLAGYPNPSPSQSNPNPAQALLGYLKDEIVTFTDYTEQSDDITLMVIQV